MLLIQGATVGPITNKLYIISTIFNNSNADSTLFGVENQGNTGNLMRV